jgi:hypothetical protein
MAEITDLEFEVRPSVNLNMLMVIITGKLHFNEFDRKTNINYSLTYRVFAIDAGEGGDPVELESVTADPVEFSDIPAGSPTPNDLPLFAGFEVDRTALDEDGPGEIDELQVRVDLEPKLPQATTFRSAVQDVDLRASSNAAS